MKKYFTLLAVASVFTMANAQEEIAGVKYDDGIAKKWELKIGGAAFTDFTNETPKQGKLKGSEAWGIDAGIGYNFTSNWFLGLNSGFYDSWGGVKGLDKGSNVIPALADVVYRWNLGTKEKWSIFLEGRGGYLFSLENDYKYLGKDREVNGYYYADAQAGVYYRIRRNIDLKLSAGWGYAWNRNDDIDPIITHNGGGCSSGC